MKKVIFFISMLIFAELLSAQNTFPSNGNVGIGTTNPTKDLEVIGFVKANSLVLLNESTNVGSLKVGQSGDDYYSEVVAGDSYSFEYFSNNHKQRISTILTEPNSSNPNGYFQTYYFDSNGIPFFQLVNAGYGSFLSLPKPETKLLIGGGSWLSSPHKFVVNSGSSYFNDNVGIASESFIDIADNNKEYKLSVGGRIRAEAVKVYTDWADFVFKSNYKLPTLREVEAYIKANGHLKDIPSAKDVEKNGIELGEMNKLLLQKIEELTLYTIELRKELDAIKTKIESHEAKN